MPALRPSRLTGLAASVATCALLVSGAPASSALATAQSAPASLTTHDGGRPSYAEKTPVARGTGGAVSSVDVNATRIGLEVLRKGGNAVDAAVATAAALGVTEPFSAGIGGGGYFVHYDARSGRVRTLDGRETAPESMPRDAFLDPETSEPRPFAHLVTSGVSVGVPGTLATWEEALDRWGSRELGTLLRPAARLARRGFVVDETFALQTRENQARFEAFTSTPEVFLPGGEVPAVGSVFRNRDLARTYETIARRGTDWFYRGRLAREISAVVQAPPKTPTTPLPVPAGYLQPQDLRDYDVIVRNPTRVDYQGYDVYGMPPSSSGGTTVGEALNILEALQDRGTGTTERLHHYLEASALAFADRNAFVGDPAFTAVPVDRLLDPRFAAERACEVGDEALTKPVPALTGAYDGQCAAPTQRAGVAAAADDNLETTNLTVVDRWGNVVEYTLTIEQTGGSGLVVPGRGFLLNNELTDFSTGVWDPEDPNRLEGGKRPRSSMAPTIVLRDGKPFLALGSPGGSTIITTVLQVLLNRIDLGMPIEDAVAAPRASQRNTARVSAEQAFINDQGGPLSALGHAFAPAGAPGTSAAEIGAVTAVELGGPRNRHLVAVAEPTRRGGGSAMVVSPRTVGAGR